ncbi:hypothetical protein OG738_24040 [Amycolatopsis sp. NBC_01488]|uniref:hypothetical protein n=1 Tax=Amycolatopsis sp. NBC_01488 TaxID=2903563 RepID=UPI002E2C3911|nr:hypothetical protein [Amycolatopsis sp. NBC_01488]
MKLTRLAKECKEGECDTVFLSDRGTLVLQGMAVFAADGMCLGAGEQAVELPVALVKEALSALAQ